MATQTKTQTHAMRMAIITNKNNAIRAEMVRSQIEMDKLIARVCKR